MRTNFIFLVATLIIFVSCKKSDDVKPSLPYIAIKGTISGSNPKNVSLKSTQTLSLSETKTILIYNSTGYRLFDVQNGTFSAYALSGTAPAIAFLNASNQFIGCLSAGGLNVLPLVSLKNGASTIIDLGNLTLDGTRVIPVNNPIGNEIILSSEDIDRYKALGSYYESLSKNIDSDNDGLPDILANKNFNISTIFDIQCGTWGLNNSPPELIGYDRVFVGYCIRIGGGKGLIPSNHNITFSGPEGNPYNDIQQTGYSPAPDGFITGFKRIVSNGLPIPYNNLPFMQGKYTITLDSKYYTLNYSNIDLKYYLILALPTIHTNDKNEITSVSIEYKNMSNEPIIGENFVFQTQITLRNNGTILSQMGALWENPETKTNTELYNFKLPNPIPLSELKNMSVMYVDLIGNSYSINFN